MSLSIKPVLVTAAVAAGFYIAGPSGAMAPLATYGLYKVINECNKPHEETEEKASSLSPLSYSSLSPLSYTEAKGRNKKIFKENGQIMRARQYISSSGKAISINMPSENDTVIIDPDYRGRVSDYDRIKRSKGNPYEILAPKDTKIEVLNNDCLEVTLDLQKRGFNPILLNMANQTSMGGSYVDGARAQEEDICRRTTLYGALGTTKLKNKALKNLSVMQFRYNTDYKIPEFGCIASRNIQVLRDKNYKFLDEPKFIDVISSAAYNMNEKFVGNDRDKFKDGKDFEDKTKNKLRNILKTAILSGHNAVVLSAFGCGAFASDPKVVSKIFNEVLNEKSDIKELKGKLYKDAIKAVFAIIGDHNDTKGNYQTFKREFV